jgi:hypothetical protein
MTRLVMLVRFLDEAMPPEGDSPCSNLRGGRAHLRTRSVGISPGVGAELAVARGATRIHALP